jgi:hypothetical protein
MGSVTGPNKCLEKAWKKFGDEVLPEHIFRELNANQTIDITS